jgi:hypothetical protein
VTAISRAAPRRIRAALLRLRRLEAIRELSNCFELLLRKDDLSITIPTA